MKQIQLEKFSPGYYEPQGDYKSFIPTHINAEWTWSTPKISRLLAEASYEIGSLNMYSGKIPNIDLYIQMHIVTEANKSSKIEGTQTNIEEDLMPLEELSPEKRDDQQEVRNYIQALKHGIAAILQEDMPLSTRLIKQTHYLLLQNVRGKHKSPGEYRTSQNWIGGGRPGNAMFVPPPATLINDLMGDLENFLHNPNIDAPELIRIAIAHYQFETIHPFLDGNGRVGRLLIPLFLLEQNLLEQPCFYISDFFEKNKSDYYTALNDVREYGNMRAWIEFFLAAVIETSKSARSKFENVTLLVNSYDAISPQIAGSISTVRAILETFYKWPINRINDIVEATDLTQNTVRNTVNSMVEHRILTEITGSSRNKVYVAEDYLRVFMSEKQQNPT
ncbi:MAG: Fic family protein [Veillonellaceae bacterium]|nr:Fic family protein [Veillonellaceae bacterium]